MTWPNSQLKEGDVEIRGVALESEAAVDKLNS